MGRLKAIQCGSPTAVSIINQLNRCSSNIVLQWILSHSGFTGNTLADLEARSAVYNLNEPYQPMSLRSAISALTRMIRDPS